MHVLIARNGDRWGAWLRESPDLAWSLHSDDHRLEPLIDDALGLAFKTKPPMEFTFSTRQHEIVASEIVERPEDMAKAHLGVEIEALMAEGRFDGDDRWALVTRQARTGHIWSMGLDGAFRERALRDRIKQWFVDSDWRSFGPPNPRYPGSRPPPWERELIVRHGDDWRARRICPDSFPKFTPGFPQPRVWPPRMEAKPAS